MEGKTAFYKCPTKHPDEPNGDYLRFEKKDYIYLEAPESDIPHLLADGWSLHPIEAKAMRPVTELLSGTEIQSLLQHVDDDGNVIDEEDSQEWI